MNRTHSRFFPVMLALSAGLGIQCQAQTPGAMAPVMAPATTEARLYSTMPARSIHRPEMAMDGDDNSYFQSVYGMGNGDDFTVLLSQPIPVRSMRISTGTPEGDNMLTKGYVETSADGVTYTRAASFDNKGVASGILNNQMVMAVRIKVSTGISKLVVREITLDSPTKIGYVSWGAGRAFSDYSVAPDLKTWSDRADKEMASFWGDTAAMLYSDNFITPNKVNVIYRGGPNVTPVAATGGGVMTVNIAWARAHPEDTGLTVHEVAHVVQSMSAYNPVWLIEGVADYIRWIKFEPQNYKVNINPDKANYNDAYRTTATFLAWCELNYDSELVTKLNNDIRFGKYTNDKFKQYCGKPVETLWQEFITAYRANPGNSVITPLMAPADRPRVLPAVTPGSSVSVDLAGAYNTVGLTKNGASFGAEAGFDGGGASFSSDLVGRSQTSKEVKFTIGAPGVNNVVAARGNILALPQKKATTLWMLAAAVEGSQNAQEFTVTYTDGTTQTLTQNFSDWYAPQNFPGESSAVKMDYRNMMDGTKDPRPFSLYSYGFALDGSKTVKSLKLPDNPNVRIAAVSLAN